MTTAVRHGSTVTVRRATRAGTGRHQAGGRHLGRRHGRARRPPAGHRRRVPVGLPRQDLRVGLRDARGAGAGSTAAPRRRASCRAWAPDPSRASSTAWRASSAMDWLFMAGLLGIGSALLLGVALRPAAASGVLLLAMMWCATWPPATTAGGEPTHSTNPLVDDHVVTALALVVIAAVGARTAGRLGRQLAAAVGRPGAAVAAVTRPRRDRTWRRARREGRPHARLEPSGVPPHRGARRPGRGPDAGRSATASRCGSAHEAVHARAGRGGAVRRRGTPR